MANSVSSNDGASKKSSPPPRSHIANPQPKQTHHFPSPRKPRMNFNVNGNLPSSNSSMGNQNNNYPNIRGDFGIEMFLNSIRSSFVASSADFNKYGTGPHSNGRSNPTVPCYGSYRFPTGIAMPPIQNVPNQFYSHTSTVSSLFNINYLSNDRKGVNLVPDLYPDIGNSTNLLTHTRSQNSFDESNDTRYIYGGGGGVDSAVGYTHSNKNGGNNVGIAVSAALGGGGADGSMQMSPCLRSDHTACADDLGNYAMHIDQMEIVWHGEFERLFSQYTPNQWFLLPTPTPPGDRWRVFKDSAKVRFSCQECGHGWTSMKGRVIFWFNLNYTTNSGWVMFKLYGQQCQKCKNGKYEHAMWYPEEVVKVVGNVYNRVGQIFYGFVRPPLRIDRRQGKPRNQHNTELCQACKDGLCKEEWSFS